MNVWTPREMGDTEVRHRLHSFSWKKDLAHLGKLECFASLVLVVSTHSGPGVHRLKTLKDGGKKPTRYTDFVGTLSGGILGRFNLLGALAAQNGSVSRSLLTPARNRRLRVRHLPRSLRI